jgi:hypothetical protein
MERIQKPTETSGHRVSRTLGRLLRKSGLKSASKANEAPIIKFDADTPSDTLLIAFGGVAKKMGGTPPYEFKNLTENLRAQRMFVKDPLQAWYQLGLPPKHGSNFAEASESLKLIVEASDINRLVTIGTSSGGYAAMAFGIELGADQVVAISPQSVIAPDLLNEMGDDRWLEVRAKLAAPGVIDERWADLRPRLTGIERTAVDIHYDTTDVLDRRHAEHLAGLDLVTLHRHEEGGHQLAGHLRASGALLSIVLAACKDTDVNH